MKDDLTEPTLTPNRRQFLQLGAMVTAAFQLDHSALADAVHPSPARSMINNPDRVEKCASMGEEFAHSYCSHAEACKNTLAIFRKTGIPIAT